MKYSNIIFIVMIFLSFVFVTQDSLAFSDNFKDVNSIINNRDSAQTEYNNNLDLVPRFFKSMFGNERINLTITMTDNSVKHFSIETRKGYVKTITEDVFDDYTIDISLTELTANRIINSKDQIKSLKQALDTHEITYKPHRFRTFVKVFVSKLFII